MLLHFIDSHESHPPSELFGLTIWWRQQDDSWADRAFGVLSAHFFSIDCEPREASPLAEGETGGGV
jgi:hypothetical protein